MRLFFAAFPDGDSRQRIAAGAQTLELVGRPIHHPSEKYHVTLVFIGGVSDSVVPVVRAIGAAQAVECVSLRLDRWEYWDGAHAIVATTPDRPEPLLRLRASLTAGLTRRGVAFDDKPLRPHITVARKVAQAPVLQEFSEFICTLREFSLLASVSHPGGSVYTVVDSWPLLDIAVRR